MHDDVHDGVRYRGMFCEYALLFLCSRSCWACYFAHPNHRKRIEIRTAAGLISQHAGRCNILGFVCGDTLYPGRLSSAIGLLGPANPINTTLADLPLDYDRDPRL